MTPSFFILILLGLIAGALTWWWLRRRRGPRPSLPSAGTEAPILGAALAWLKDLPDTPPRTLEIDGENIHFIQTGQGPDLVLLHGIGASFFTWRLVIPELARHFRVTALDLPGFGRSHKADRGDYGLDLQRRRLGAFLSTLGVDQAYLVGSSMGGAIALWMAHENPRRFPKVAVLGPATSPELIPKKLSQSLSSAPLSKTVNRFTMKLILHYVLTRRELITKDTIEAYLEPYLDDGLSVKTFFAALQLLGDARMPQCFAGMKSEVLVMYGVRDRLVTSRSIQRLMKVMPQARLVTNPDGGHHIMEDEPAWTVEQLLEFFKSR